MYQRVHLFMSGCLTLKLSAEWKTVSCSLLLGELAAPSVTVSASPLGGETGISVRGRCSSGMADWDDSAMVIVCKFLS